MAAPYDEAPVSCTVVCLSSSGCTSGVHSHTFCGLSVPSWSLAVCPFTGVQAIDAATLLYSFIISRCLAERDNIPDHLFSLLTSADKYSQIRVRTTRIPIFDERMGNPAYGNRGLGLLSDFFGPNFPPALTISAIDHQGDWLLPEVVAAKNSWTMMGIQLPFHFILIVSLDNNLPISAPHLLPLNTNFPSAASISLTSPHPSPQLDTFNADLFDTDLQELFGLPDPPLNFDTMPVGLTDHQSTTPDPSPVNAESSSGHDNDYRLQLVSGMSLHDVILAAGITPEEQKHAWFNADTPDLWHKYQNHRAMCTILEVLGLASDQERFSVQYKGGLRLSTSEVVSHFNWVSRTFIKKTKAFHHAQLTVARYSWQGTVPRAKPATDLLKAVRKDFEAWNGLVAMFGVGGFCEQNSAPRDHLPADEWERHAAKVSQEWLFNLKKHCRRLHPTHIRLRGVPPN
ncbi:hypothetical protein DFH06DRAFT_1482335 [Mycena polygramma]|nr:hypothetical protein DFH06DRAFT_1482335 [Mycena polygramma]